MRTPGRVVVFAILAGAGCMARVARDAHTGRDGTPRHARRMAELPDERSSRARGIVTARGGDAVDWFRFDVYGGGCDGGSADVRLFWRPARPGMRLAVDVFDDQLHHLRQSIRLGPTTIHTRVGSLAYGRYYVAVSAPGRDEAAAYRLDVVTSDASDGWACYQ